MTTRATAWSGWASRCPSPSACSTPPAVALGWLAVLLARLDTVSGLLLVGFVLTVGTFLMGLLSAVPVYDNSKQRQVMLRVVRDHEPEERAG